MEFKTLSSITQINAQLWNDFVINNGGTVFHSYEWLASYEKIHIFSVIPMHQVIINHDRILGIMPLFLTTGCPRIKAMREILVSHQTTLQEPFLLSHSLYSFYGFPVVENERIDLYDMLIGQLTKLASKYETEVFGFINIPETNNIFLKVLQQRNYNFSYLSSDESIEIKWNTYKDYLYSLPVKSRRRIIKTERVYRSQHYYFKVLNSDNVDINYFHYMVIRIFEKHNHEDKELFPIEYLKTIINDMGEKVFFIAIYNNENECVSINLCMKFGTTITVWIAGVDYQRTGKISYHYFYGWIIKYAIENDYKFVDLGRGTYDLKSIYGYKRTKLFFGSNTINASLRFELERWCKDYADNALDRYRRTVGGKHE